MTATQYFSLFHFSFFFFSSILSIFKDHIRNHWIWYITFPKKRKRTVATNTNYIKTFAAIKRECEYSYKYLTIKSFRKFSSRKKFTECNIPADVNLIRKRLLVLCHIYKQVFIQYYRLLETTTATIKNLTRENKN